MLKLMNAMYFFFCKGVRTQSRFYSPTISVHGGVVTQVIGAVVDVQVCLLIQFSIFN